MGGSEGPLIILWGLPFKFFNIKQKGGKTVAIRKFCLCLAIVSIFVTVIWLLGSVPQATAETRNFKIFNHVTKIETMPIADVEGHFISVSVREGVTIYGDGELAWNKATAVSDSIKGAGTFEMYATNTFQDGSTYTTRTKGAAQATPTGVSTTAKWTSEIIHGTGRFKGIKGTVTSSTKFFPLGKGELGGKTLSEGTLVYTLPSK
jgi:hypothetical protein